MSQLIIRLKGMWKSSYNQECVLRFFEDPELDETVMSIVTPNEISDDDASEFIKRVFGVENEHILKVDIVANFPKLK
jgi:hypothetical protein